MADGPGGVDWSTMIFDLLRAGHDVVSIATATGSGKTTVKDWKQNTTSPRFEAGDSLVSLWCEVTGKSRNSVPRLR